MTDFKTQSSHVNVPLPYHHKGKLLWDGVGVAVHPAWDRSTIMQRAGQDYIVETARLFMYDQHKPGPIEVPGVQAIRRTYPKGNEVRVLGKAGARYQPIQNSVMYDVADLLVKNGKANYCNAGTALGGRYAWVIVQLVSAYKVAHGDFVDEYLLILNNHNGKGSMKILFTPVHVNTHTVLFAPDRARPRITHSGGLCWDFRNADGLWKMCQRVFTKAGRVYSKMHERKLRMPTDASDFFNKALPRGKGIHGTHRMRIQASLHRLYREKIRSSGEYSLWAAYNAVMEYLDHVRLSCRTQEGRLIRGLIEDVPRRRAKVLKAATNFMRS